MLLWWAELRGSGDGACLCVTAEIKSRATGEAESKNNGLVLCYLDISFSEILRKT